MLTCKTSLHKDVNHLYHNIYITNNTNDYQPAQFLESRNVPIVDKADEYELSVVRFNVPGANIPIFNFKDNTYFVSLRIQTTPGPNPSFLNFQRYVNYNAIDYPNSLIVDPNDRGVYSYRRFLRMVNEALTNAFNDLKAVYPGLTITNAPFLDLSSTTQQVNLYVQDTYLQNQPFAPVRILFNESLFSFFQSFQSGTTLILDNPISPPYIGQPDAAPTVKPGLNQSYAFGITLQNFGDNYLTTINQPDGPPAVYYNGFVIKQEFPCLYLWNECQGIQFLTYNIPVYNESVSNPSLGPTLPAVNASNNRDVTYKTLCDVELSTTQGPENRNNILYLPTAEFRIKDLVSNLEVRTTDFTIYWVSKSGQLFPLLLSPGDSVSVKILYRKKGWQFSTIK